MNKKEKNTTQEFPTVSKRIGAMFIDLIIIYFIFYISGKIFSLTGSDSETIKYIIFLVLAALYEPVFVSFFCCTIGQFFVNLKVKSHQDGNKKISYLKAFFRFYSKYIFGILSIFSTGFNKERRAIHDLIGGSIVVYANQENSKYVFSELAIVKNKWIRFSFASLIFVLLIIWIENYWLLLGLPIFYDIYISKKVNWAFWKKRAKDGVKPKKGKVAEWIDAIVFAVIAATIIRTLFIEAFVIPTSSMEKSLLVGDYLFVSKVAYGPKLPKTPLAIPFTHNSFMGKYEPYIKTSGLPYKRAAGIGEIKRYDAMVFNFPTGDTCVVGRTNQGYYDIIRVEAYGLRENDRMRGDSSRSWNWYLKMARDRVWRNYEIMVRPTDKMDNYIKRCVGLPGDKLEIKAGQLYINDEKQKYFSGRQYNYLVITDGSRINPKTLDKLEISQDDINKSKDFIYDPNAIKLLQDTTLKNIDVNNVFMYPFTDENYEKVKSFAFVKHIIKLIDPKGERNFRIFPHSENYNWNEDWFGPMVIPAEGATVKLTIENLPLYQRIIDHYENNDLVVKGEDIYINGKKASEYTFKQDYFWLMGDNRHGSADSRFWGFVPMDHVVGKAVFIWMSLDKDKGWFNGKIRWNRLFTLVGNIE